MMGNRIRGMVLACAILCTTPWVVHAQEATPATAPDATPKDETAQKGGKGGGEIEPVVVTAEKRSEDASKVPLSITAINGEELQQLHVTDITDLTRVVPNLSFSGQSGVGSGLENLEIRGISSQAGSGTVGIYLDDVSLTTRNLYSLGSPEPKFFDIDRVEVLRGPQGTLYGAGSEGGTIKFISNQPDLQESQKNVYAEVSGTDHGGVNTTDNVVINAPVLPGVLAVRLGVEVIQQSGYIDQVSPTTGSVIASGINAERDAVLKLSAKWQPTDRLTVTPAFFFQETSTNDIDASYLNLPENQTSKLVREPGDDRLSIPSLTVNYDLGFADLISVSSYYSRDFNRTQDGTVINSQYIGGYLNSLPASPPGLGNTVSNLPSAVYLLNQVRQVSEEVRLASKPYVANGNPFTWLGGVYYSNLHTTVSDNEPVFGLNAAFSAAGVNPADPDLLGFAFPGDNSYFSIRHYHTVQDAVFGEVNYYFTPAWRLTLGVRYLDAKDELERDGNYFFANGPQHSDVQSSFDATTPKVALSWQIDPADMVYSTVSQGVRLGSENRPIPYNVCATDFQALDLSGAPNSFNPDNLWNFEVGDKSTLFDRRVSLSAALFYIKWNSIQQDIELPTCGYDFETNIGKAKSYGAEFEIRARATDHLTVNFSGGYTHAVLTTAVPSLGVNPGDPIEGSPKYNALFGLEYRAQLSPDAEWFVRGDSHWVGSSHGTLVKTDPDYQRPAYNVLDASIGTAFQTYEVSLFAKNLLNNDKVIQRPNVQSVSEGYRLRPLTVGVSLSGQL